MRPLLTNAQLLKVEGGGYAKEGRRASGARPVKWNAADVGNEPEPVYVDEHSRVLVGGDQSRVKETTVLVDGALADLAGIENGDTVTIAYGGTTQLRLVRENDRVDALGASVDRQLVLADE